MSRVYVRGKFVKGYLSLTSSFQLHAYMDHVVTPGFVVRPRRSECTAGQMDGEASWWTTSRKFGLTH